MTDLKDTCLLAEAPARSPDEGGEPSWFAPAVLAARPAQEGSRLRRSFRRLLESRMRRSGQVARDRDLRRSAMVLAPHFDDEVLGCGGTIIRKRAAGAHVSIVFLTDGGRSHAHLMPEAQLRQVRAAEGRAAARAMGVPADEVTLLDFPETRLAEHVADAGQRVLALLRRQRPEEVFVPYRRDGNHDHVATYNALMLAVRGYDRPVWLYEYPVWFWCRWPWVPDRPGRPRHVPRFCRDTLLGAIRAWRECRWAVPVADVLEQKRSALLQHRSQMMRWNGHPAWPVLSDVAAGQFLARFFGDHEVFARRRLVGGDDAVRRRGGAERGPP